MNDAATGDYLFANKEGQPFASIKKGFAAACQRAKIKNLRLYDLRPTFATRLQGRLRGGVGKIGYERAGRGDRASGLVY